MISIAIFHIINEKVILFSQNKKYKTERVKKITLNGIFRVLVKLNFCIFYMLICLEIVFHREFRLKKILSLVSIMFIFSFS